jgi:predicted amidohydrolase
MTTEGRIGDQDTCQTGDHNRDHDRQGFFVCTGWVDTPATPTYRATTPTTSTRPDHIVTSHSLSQSLCFTRVVRQNFVKKGM